LFFSEKFTKREGWIKESFIKTAHELIDQVKKLEIDPLTNFFGRPFLLPKLNELIKELNSIELHHRKSEINAIMVIVLDMNGLKFFNDNYNHAVGDKALITLAERIKKTTRRNDILFRPGGDEFVVFLPIENEDVDLILDWLLLGYGSKEEDPTRARLSKTQQDRLNKQINTNSFVGRKDI